LRIANECRPFTAAKSSSRLRNCTARVVLNNVSEQIRECLRHAEECARKAAEFPNGNPSRQDFLQLEKRWIDLARRFGENQNSFTKH
jgi:hypothetical protein